MAIFDYQSVRTFENTLQVNDIGNCAIRGEGSYKDGKIRFPGEYYLITKTIMGRTYIAKFGPIAPNIPGMPNTFSVSFKIVAYKEPTIEREINLFLNDSFASIENAEEILEQEAFDVYPSLEETFNNL